MSRGRSPLSAGAALAAVAALLALGGCGLGAGPAPGRVRLTVTRDFGAAAVPPGHGLRVRGEETAMSLLMRNYRVATGYGGGFVESIDGFAGGRPGGEPVDWFYYVNGLEAAKGAAETTVRPGDRIWWDLHDWSQTAYTPAVVGSFPEPFLDGIHGRRLPVRIECAASSSGPCHTVAARLLAAGVPAAVAAPGASGESTDILRIAVGPWSAIRALPAAAELARGPAASGVYARVEAGGGALALLAESGRVAQTIGAGAGLVAALRYPGAAPLWVVTGIGASGVQAAAGAFSASALDDHFAVAVAPGGATLPLPRSR